MFRPLGAHEALRNPPEFTFDARNQAVETLAVSRLPAKE
jgi:hypothetical protein